METRLCEFCLRSGVLCSKCREKLRSGEVSELYMKVAKFLLDLEDRYPLIQDTALVDVVEEDGVLALVVDGGDREKFISYGGRLLREVRDAFRRRVIVIEAGGSERRFLEDLFSGQRILTINVIWLPDGSSETRIVLAGRRMNEKRMRALTEIARRVRGLSLRVEYA
ncbi:MAG: transcription elongation factor [Candidatus Bathyarchaeota archaeon B23]|nr:MAG: transcription elongation factor [Candidatus Bathyarchaeota archaeon B23]